MDRAKQLRKTKAYEFWLSLLTMLRDESLDYDNFLYDLFKMLDRKKMFKTRSNALVNEEALDLVILEGFK
jgi:hypothetical protein